MGFFIEEQEALSDIPQATTELHSTEMHSSGKQLRVPTHSDCTTRAELIPLFQSSQGQLCHA